MGHRAGVVLKDIPNVKAVQDACLGAFASSLPCSMLAIASFSWHCSCVPLLDQLYMIDFILDDGIIILFWGAFILQCIQNVCLWDQEESVLVAARE